MKNRTYLFNGKTVDLWGDDPAGWTIYTGDDSQSTDADYYKFIPTLFRAVQLRSYSVSSMPFQLMKGKTIYDESIDWQNKVGFIPNPFTLLQLIESALVMAGRCYLFRERSVATIKSLHYHLPSSVTPEINKNTGKIDYFIRPVNGVPKHFKPEDYVYFWSPDPYVEVGPATNYPARAAATACGVLLNMDIFSAGFFERGAIKAMLLTVTGMPAESERQKLSDWWRRVVGGVKNAFGAQIISAEAVKPVVVGEGMKELENVTIGEEKREDIAIAVGIPMSILFANAANYATSQQDELNFLTKTIIPECQFIESILNEQIFEALGLHWTFMPETLDAMQEDESARAAALQQLTGAGLPLLMAMDILGYELTDEQRAELEKAEEEKKKKAEELAQQMAQKPEEEEEPEEQEQMAQVKSGFVSDEQRIGFYTGGPGGDGENNNGVYGRVVGTTWGPYGLEEESDRDHKIIVVEKLSTEALDDQGMIAVCFKGKNKGITLYCDVYTDHGIMIDNFDSDDNVDNYIRFTLEGDGILHANSLTSGVVVNSKEDYFMALDNIYKAAGKLHYLGWPKNTPLWIDADMFGSGQSSVYTTIKRSIIIKPQDNTFQSELDKWRRKAINAMKKGKPANVDFVTTVIPESMCETIMTALGNAQSEADVKEAFNMTATPAPTYSESIMTLAEQLKRANDLLERTEEK